MSDHSDLERLETSPGRARRWFEDLIVVLAIGSVGWFFGTSLLELVSKGGWIAMASVAAAGVAALLWFWRSSWSSRAKLFCAAVVVLMIAVPFASRYL